MIVAASTSSIVHVNATLNAVAAVLLLTGLALVRRGHVTAHQRVMLAAFGVSVAFLGCYVWYHYQAGHVEFTQTGAVRYAYLAILATHVVLALIVPPLAVWTIYLGFRAVRGERHFLAVGDVNRATDRWTESPPTPRRAEPARQAAPQRSAQRERHCRWARWTFPVWLYVSISGVAVYVMLYHLWPPLEP